MYFLKLIRERVNLKQYIDSGPNLTRKKNYEKCSKNFQWFYDCKLPVKDIKRKNIDLLCYVIFIKIIIFTCLSNYLPQ